MGSNLCSEDSLQKNKDSAKFMTLEYVGVKDF